MNKCFILIFIFISFYSNASDDFTNAKKAYKSGDFKKAMILYKEASADRNLDAPFELGTMYENGFGVNKDHETAMQWYKKGAINGDERAVSVFRKAAKQGDSKAQNTLGDLYFQGYGDLEKYGRYDDTEIGVKWYLLAAEQGNSNAKNSLFKIFSDWSRLLDGDAGLTEKNIDSALIAKVIKWLTKLADEGNTESQFILAEIYSNETEKSKEYLDKSAALKLYKKAGDTGLKKAQWSLGLIYHNGIGVTVNEDVAEKWYIKAAQNGNSELQLQLGSNYISGVSIKKNINKGIKWIKRSAKQGNQKAQIKLAEMYYSGDKIDKNIDEAIDWYKVAATLGDFSSKIKLASIYSQGLELPLNLEESKKWLKKAENNYSQYNYLKLANMYCSGEPIKKDLATCGRLLNEVHIKSNKDVSEIWNKYELSSHYTIPDSQTNHNNLCLISQGSVFSCQIGKKTLSICRENKNITYLYGTKDNIEITLSSPTYYSTSYPRGGVSGLKFINGQVSYQIIIKDLLGNYSWDKNGRYFMSDMTNESTLIISNGERTWAKECSDFSYFEGFPESLEKHEPEPEYEKWY